MPSQELVYHPIGVIHSPHRQPKGTPIQPGAARGVRGTVEVFEQYARGLRDLDGFSHLFLLYHFHRASPAKLLAKPFVDEVERGIFSVRAPARPNPIGISLVRQTGLQGNLINVEDLDILDGTPLLDIKPYVPQFDQPEGEVSVGWLTEMQERTKGLKADNRHGN